MMAKVKYSSASYGKSVNQLQQGSLVSQRKTFVKPTHLEINKVQRFLI
jgi:hypothetical protein